MPTVDSAKILFMPITKHTQAWYKRKGDRFKAKRNMTRTEWAAFKRKHELPKIVIGNEWKKLI